MADTVYGQSGALLAIIVSERPAGTGSHFITPDNLQQQVAVMNRPAGEIIPAHAHLPVQRDLTGTQEVLIVEKGELRVDLYDTDKTPAHSYVAGPGDVVVLVAGWHGFEVLKECEFIEVKQGPYTAGSDKILLESGAVL